MTMNILINHLTQKLILLCLFVGTATVGANVPVRDYRVVNFDNGITTKLIEIGTTSVTFSVECSLGTDIPAKLDLIGKLNMDWETWNFWGEMKVVQKDGYATAEYRYSRFSDLEPEATMFAQKAFFSLQMSVEPEDWERVWGLEGYGQKGTVEPPIKASPVVITETEVQEQNLTVKDETSRRSGIKGEQGGVTENEANVSSPNYWWLCLGIVLLLSAVFYFVRRRR